MLVQHNKKNDFHIRKANREDIPVLVTFLVKLALHVAGGPEQSLKQSEHDRLSEFMLNALSDKDKLVVVAEDKDSEVIGMAYLAILRSLNIWEASEPLEFKTGIIDDVWVEPSCRKHGVFSALLKNLISFAEKEGVEELALEYSVTNQEADATWSKLGFKPTGIRATAFTASVRDALDRNKSKA